MANSNEKNTALAAFGGKPVREKFLVFGKPAIGSKEIDEVVDSLKSGWIGTGPKVAKFEEAFRKYIGSRYAVAVNSCTAALHLALLVHDIGEGDEVITTPMTFCATANVIIHAGATPVFVLFFMGWSRPTRRLWIGLIKISKYRRLKKVCGWRKLPALIRTLQQ